MLYTHNALINQSDSFIPTSLNTKILNDNDFHTKCVDKSSIIENKLKYTCSSVTKI